MTTTSEVPNETQTTDEQMDAASKVDKTGQRIQKMFGEISGRYDFLNHFLSGGVDIYWRWRTVRRVRPDTDAPILDVCTGTGDLAIAFWKKADRKLPVAGTDFTHEMLVIAREKAAKLTDPNPTAAPIEFLEADTLTLPFDADSFQIVSVAFGLRNVVDTLGGLREMTRVCQPGGQVAVLEFSMPTNRLFGAVYRWYFRNILPCIGQLLARNQEAAYNYLPQSVSQFPQGEELCGLMRDAGLADVTFTPLTFGIATLYVGQKPSEQ
ncbi:MAG: bifunctional demethylmenaquinone methyltransferase/2-methoxy-6-polyprenyl-1,4-benzoquinol methylase UbiE [Planctomycetota bacterium]|jgi:demethylmenaquinone methyltransferase/2-methoxy-6-polyprenyl-1,4-benzoquinol methylase